MDEIKSLVEKQENDHSKLKDAVQKIEKKCEEQDMLLQRILSAVENLSSGPSRFQSKSVKSMRFRLKKAQQDNPSSSLLSNISFDDSTFPLLP